MGTLVTTDWELPFSNFDPTLKFNGKTGKLTVENDEELPIGTMMIFDVYVLGKDEDQRVIPTAKQAWIRYGRGQVPDFHGAVRFGQKLGPQPTEDHKRGWRLGVGVEGKGIYDFSPNAWGTCQVTQRIVVQSLHLADEYHDGGVPLVEFQGAEERSYERGDAFAPIFKIVKWIARPAYMKRDDEGPKLLAKPEPAAPAQSEYDDTPAAPAPVKRGGRKAQSIKDAVRIDDDIPF
jgi:hypothetical protein